MMTNENTFTVSLHSSGFFVLYRESKDSPWKLGESDKRWIEALQGAKMWAELYGQYNVMVGYRMPVVGEVTMSMHPHFAYKPKTEEEEKE